MNVIAIIAGVVFLIIGILLTLLAYRSRKGTVAPTAWLSLKKRELRVSDEAWRQGHTTAWPLIGMAAAVAFFHACGCLLAGVLMGAQGESFSQVLIVSGCIVTVALWFVAQAAAASTLTHGRSPSER